MLSSPNIFVLAVLESISVLLILRLWARKRKTSLLFRLFWSLALLVPFLGPLFYGFVATSPDDHGEDLPEYPEAGSGHH
jgi:hypothetical protein